MTQIPQIMLQAEQAMQAGDWALAQQLFQQVLDLDPNTPYASQGLHNARRAVDKEKDLKERIAEAETQFAQGDYQGARRQFAAIMDFAAAEPRILKFHTTLEERRNRANDLDVWSGRVNKALQEARRLGGHPGGSLAAGQSVEDVLSQLPQEADYQPLRGQLEAFRINALQQGNDEEIFQQALALLKAKEFTKVIECLKLIDRDSQSYESAQKLLTQAELHLDKQRLELAPIENMIADKHWADALALLEHVSTDHKDTPGWRSLSLRANIAYGREMLEEGRQYNDRRSFDQARRKFEDARKAFAAVFQLYPRHLDALPLQDEAADLAAIAGCEKQALSDVEEGKRPEAVEALKLAKQRVEHAKGEGREYAAVGIMVDTLLNTVEAEIRRIREEERRLHEGENLWNKNHLSEARQRFQETLDALLPEHRQQALDGLQRVEGRIAQFQKLLEQGQAARDPLAAVNFLQEAYVLWEEGPGARVALETTLVQACESELEGGRETAAAGFGQRALALNPQNREAKDCVRKAGEGPEIAAILEVVQRELELLALRGEIASEALAPLLVQLETALRKAESWPDLREKVATRHQELREQQRHWQQYEQHYRRAQARRSTGEWVEACQAFREALAALGDAAPDRVRKEYDLWQAAEAALSHAQAESTAALESAQATYDAVSRAETLAEMGEGFAVVLAHLDVGLKALREAREGVQAAEGALPVVIVDLQKQIETLHVRTKVAQEAARAPSAADGLIKLQEVMRVHGEEPTLAATRKLLRKEAAKDIEALKQSAQNDAQVGDFDAALDKLSQVRQLEPTDTETTKLYAELQQRKKLEEELHQIQRDVDSKIADNSPAEALRVLRYQGLTRLLAPDVAVSAQVREILNRLIELGDRDDAQALGNPEHWDEAQKLITTLENLRSENWAAQRAVEFVEQWKSLARDNALRGLVRSTAALRDFLGSYSAAALYHKKHPEEDFANKQLIERQDALVGQLNESAQKRLGRARVALQKHGDYEIALQNLEDIEKDFYAEIDARFPGLLDGLPGVQAVRDEIENIRTAAQKLQALAEKAQPKLDIAQQAYLENQWDTAEAALKALPDLKDAPALNTKAEDLRDRIAKARVDAMRKRLHEVLSRVETSSRIAPTSEALDVCLEELQGVQAELNLQVLDVEERNRYFQLLNEVREQKESLKLGALSEQQIETYIGRQQYEQALNVLDTALALARDANKRMALQTRRWELEPLAQSQQECALLLKHGESLFAEERYAEARQQLEKASSQGADVKDLLRAARAGVRLQSAKRMWEEKHDGESALADLEDLHGFTENNPRATAIADEARRLQRRIEKASGENLGKVRELLERARLENAPEKALRLVELALELAPDSIDARLLQNELQSTAVTEQIIVQLEQLANDGKFKEARAQLAELATRGGVASSKLREMQDLVGRLEAEQWNRVIQPIQDLYREGGYAEALNRSKLALKQTATPELQQELQSIQTSIVARWVETRSQTLRKELQRNPSEEALRDIEGQIATLQILEPAPEAQHLRQLTDLLKDACTRRLRLRIEQARARYAEWQVAGQSDLPQVALNLLKSVQDEVEDLGTQVDIDVSLDAAALEMEIRAALRERDKEQRKAERDALLAKAQEIRARLEDPVSIETQQPGRNDLEELAKLTQQVFEIASYKDDSEARTLAAWTQSALEAFDRTRKALDEAQDRLLARRFNDANYALRSVGTVSPLLRTAHGHRRTLVDALRQAESDQDKGAWAQAFDGYQQALELDPELVVLLEKDVDRCRQHLLEDVRETLMQAFAKTPPDTQVARARLEQATQANWGAPALERDYAELHNWLKSQEQVAQAAELLQKDSDPEEARELLQEARRLLPKQQSDADIRQWEALVEVLLAWKRGHYEDARNRLARIQPPIADLPRVKSLNAALIEAEKQAALIASAGTRVKAALGARPARYEEAVQILRQELGALETHSQVQALQRDVRQSLLAELESQRKAGHYSKAIESGDLLLRLAPHDAEVSDLVRILPQERREQLELALRQTEEALDAYLLSDGERHLRRADDIAAPEGDPRIEKLQRRLGDLGSTLQQLHGELREVNGLAEQKQWTQAVKRLMEVRGNAPNYEPVLETTRALQSRLMNRAEELSKAGKFAEGIDLCEQALSLEERHDITTLLSQIRDAQKAALVDIRKTIKEALDNWRLKPVAEQLDRGLTIAPKDHSLLEEQKRYAKMQSILPEVDAALNQGWAALQKGDYSAAMTAFEQALRHERNLSEAKTWRDYADTMDRAGQLMKKETSIDQVVRYLEQAETSMHVMPGTLLPDSFFSGEEQLKKNRRYAIYHAYTLRQHARRMIAWNKQADEYSRGKTTDQQALGLELLERILAEKESFLRLYESPITPPESFPLLGREDEVLPGVSDTRPPTAPAQPVVPTTQPLKSTKPASKVSETLEEAPAESAHEADASERNSGGLLGGIRSFLRRPRPEERHEEDEGELSVRQPAPTPVYAAPIEPSVTSPSIEGLSEGKPSPVEVVGVAPASGPVKPPSVISENALPPSPPKHPPLQPIEEVDVPAKPNAALDAIEETYGSGWGGFWSSADNYAEGESKKP